MAFLDDTEWLVVLQKSFATCGDLARCLNLTISILHSTLFLLFIVLNRSVIQVHLQIEHLIKLVLKSSLASMCLITCDYYYTYFA